MLYGICGGPEISPVALEAGFDYLELNAQSHLKGEADEAIFQPILEQIKNCGIPCLAANVFVPGHLKITGPEVDFPRLTHYVSVVMNRAERAGIRAMVFGSGGARRIPDGFDYSQAYSQLVEFGRMVGSIAADHGVTIAVEPLNRGETNVLNSVREGYEYVKDVNHPSFRLLVDAYHWAKENEPATDIIAAGPWLAHAHIATYANRLSPGAEDCDFKPFFTALKQAGYSLRLSVEAGWRDLPNQAASALKHLKDTAR
jgi:D-psicose/D-tagatose/L-ribulose 3-epimerase